MTNFQLRMKTEKAVAKLLGKDQVLVDFQEFNDLGRAGFMIKADGRWFDCDFDGSVVVAE